MKKIILLLHVLLISGIVANVNANGHEQKVPISQNESAICSPTYHQHGKNKQVNTQPNKFDRSVVYKLIASSYDEWDRNTNSWTPEDSALYAYNANAWQTEGDYYSYNTLWDTTSRDLYTYDVNGNVTQDIYQNWNSDSSQWKNVSRDAFTYDINNHKLSDLAQDWDTTHWKSAYESIYSYDGNGNKITELDLDADSTAWDSSYRYNYTYNGNNKVTHELDEDYSSGFVNDDQYLYSYDGNNNISMILSEQWSGSAWDTTRKSTGVYDVNNRITIEYDSTWSTGWTPDQKYQYTYDGSGNETKYEDYYWETSVWESHYEADETYDVNNNRTYEKDLAYDYDSSAIENAEQYFNYYQSFNVTGPSGIKEAANDLKASLYPNPSSGDMTVSFDLLENSNIRLNVYDAQGRVISSENHAVNSGTNIVKLNYPQISAGNYFLQLIDRSTGKASVLQFVKE